ncbi:outer membrane protein assembly factor BamB family protein [Gemmata sp.]|uniref:outer membrane protein assembly factor BamB family protein n=1 Tax=Gemmata sp. TaxID=1914242 RepID=UPI003F71BEA8
MSVVLLAAVLAADPAPAGHWVGPDVVASPDGRIVFARGKDGVEALDAATGKVLWANKTANRLAGASGTTVVAWVADEKAPNGFRVVALDAATGKTLGTSDAIKMPDWATTQKQHGRSFRIGAAAVGGKVTVAWQANASYAGGAAPPPEVEEAARKEAVGVATVDLASGKVTAEDRKPRDAEFGASRNKVGDLEFQIEEQLPGFKPGAAMVTKVMLTATKDGKPVWTRELAGNPWSPPPP